MSRKPSHFGTLKLSSDRRKAGSGRLYIGRVGYLGWPPHLDVPGHPHFVTFRRHDRLSAIRPFPACPFRRSVTSATGCQT